MKKTIALIMACVFVVLIAGCDSDTNTSDKATKPSDYTPDYFDAESFESDLNSGIKVDGKIVQFYVNAYKPDSILGINCWAGEHLNFISENELEVEKGDYIVGRITSEPEKTFGSWEIPYEVLEIRDHELENKKAADTEPESDKETKAPTEETTKPENTKPETTVPTTTEQEATTPVTTEPENTVIVMIGDSAAYVGQKSHDVVKELEDLGFENVKLVESITSDTSRTDGTVASVTIASESFSKGDSYEKDTEIVVTYWKVEKPASEYEIAFVRAMNDYSLYYMFDTDNNTVVYFGTMDTYIEEGTYFGDFASGVTINWSHGEWTEKFTHQSGSYATLIDGNGWDWEYTVCDVAEAQEILDGLR